MEGKDYVEINPQPLTEEELKALREQAKRMQEARMREKENLDTNYNNIIK